MSDDLVKRLRQPWDADRSIMSQTGRWMVERKEAADRIEELEAKGLANRVAIMRLEAKLANAVEGFEELARLGNGDRYGNSFGNLIAQKYIAELTGGKDE